MSVVVVTGASSGLGRDFVLRLSRESEVDEFWLIARREERLCELSKEVKQKCKIITADLSTADGLKKYKEALILEKPEISYLVNAAGYGKYGDYNVVDTSTAFNMIDLNIKALVYITQETLPFIKSGGKIIQMGSASTYNPLPNLNVYAASKSFVKHYSRALSYELKDKNISVTTVCPGWVKTEFFDRANIDMSFAKPLVNSKNVVEKAVKDAKKGKQVSMYALFNKTHHLAAKILPHSLLIKLWYKMQRKY